MQAIIIDKCTIDEIMKRLDQIIGYLDPPTKKPTGMLSVQDTADYLGVHINTVYRYIHSGEIPAHRIGKGKYIIDIAEAEAVIKEATP